LALSGTGAIWVSVDQAASLLVRVAARPTPPPAITNMFYETANIPHRMSDDGVRVDVA
jgi:hypothetical protein